MSALTPDEALAEAMRRASLDPAEAKSVIDHLKALGFGVSGIATPPFATAEGGFLNAAAD